MLPLVSQTVLLAVLGLADDRGAALEIAAVRVAVDPQGASASCVTARPVGLRWQPTPLAIVLPPGRRARRGGRGPAGRSQDPCDGKCLTIRYDGLLAPDKKRLDVALSCVPTRARRRRALVGAGREPPGGRHRHRAPVPADRQSASATRSGPEHQRPGRAALRRSPGPGPPAALPLHGPDQNGIKMGGMYPGIGAGTNCFVFAGPSECLYFAVTTRACNRRCICFAFRATSSTPGFVKYPFHEQAAPGPSADFVLSPYSGNWHAAAKSIGPGQLLVRTPKQPEWVCRMTGAANHPQAPVRRGAHPYNTIAQMARDGSRPASTRCFCSSGGTAEWTAPIPTTPLTRSAARRGSPPS